MDRPDGAQQLFLLRFTDDADQRHVIFQAQLGQHLTEIRRGCGVHEGAVALASHRLEHAECGQRIDE